MEHGDPQTSTQRKAVTPEEAASWKWVEEVLDDGPDLDGMGLCFAVGCIWVSR